MVILIPYIRMTLFICKELSHQIPGNRTGVIFSHAADEETEACNNELVRSLVVTESGQIPSVVWPMKGSLSILGGERTFYFSKVLN